MFAKRLPIFFAAALTIGLVAWAGTPSPRSGTQTVPAYFRGMQVMINLSEVPNKDEEDILVSDGRVNHVYFSDQARAVGIDFVAVADALQGEGSNPIWQGIQVNFLTIPPQQYTSDLDIDAAYAAGQISLNATTDIYHCSVVGAK